MTTVSPFRIPKKHIPAIKHPKAGFRLPEANYFFAKINHDKGVLANSICRDEQEQPEMQNRTMEQYSKSIVARSASLQLSRKLSVFKTEQKLMPQMHSLPKIQKRTPETTSVNEIIKSELGCFNYYDIMKQKQEISEKKLHGSHLTRLSSYLSEEDTPLDDHLHAQSEQKQLKYQDYDKVLMQPEPIIYRRRVFKLKHKADWSISK